MGGTQLPPGEPWEAVIPMLVSRLEEWPSADSAMIDRVAIAVARHSYAVGVEPHLTLAVMRVENPWLIADTVSYAGAVGLLQVMPKYWDDSFEHCGSDLTNVEVNVCKGTEILRYYIDTTDTLNEALLAYNGCRSQHCQSYSTHVQRQLD